MSKSHRIGIAGTLVLAAAVVVAERCNRTPRVDSTVTAIPARSIDAPPAPPPVATRLVSEQQIGEGQIPASDTRPLDVTVVRRLDQSPVAGAAVELWTKNGRSVAARGTTDSAGSAVLDHLAHQSERSIVRVRAAGLALCEALVDADDERETITVEMENGAAIAGKVVRSAEKPSPPGVRVAAWRKMSNAERLLEYGPGSQLSLCAVVDADGDGRFRFDDLIDGVTYRLDAAGGGCASDGFTSCARVPTLDARIEVRPVFGCIVEAREVGGAPLRASRELRTSVDAFEMVADGDADALQLPRLLALSGCPLPEELLSDQRSTFLMYAKEVESEAIGPARFLLGVAGYQSKRVEVALPRIESTIERMVVELEPLGQHEFGELSVEFVDPPWAHGSKASLGCVVGRLGMKTLEAGIPVLEFPIRSTSDQRVKLGGIPYGTYRAVFNTTGRQYSVPNRDISDLLEFTVGPIRASVQIRFGPVGALRLNIHGTDGEPFELPVSAQVRRTGDSPDGSMYPLNFLEWPYRVDAFRCGTYDILLDARVNTSIGTARVVQFHSVKVEPGKETVLDAPVVIDPPADGN